MLHKYTQRPFSRVAVFCSPMQRLSIQLDFQVCLQGSLVFVSLSFLLFLVLFLLFLYICFSCFCLSSFVFSCFCFPCFCFSCLVSLLSCFSFPCISFTCSSGISFLGLFSQSKRFIPYLASLSHMANDADAQFEAFAILGNPTPRRMPRKEPPSVPLRAPRYVPIPLSTRYPAFWLVTEMHTRLCARLSASSQHHPTDGPIISGEQTLPPPPRLCFTSASPLQFHIIKTPLYTPTDVPPLMFPLFLTDFTPT